MRHFYHSKLKLRCKVRFIKSEGVLELRVERYRNWFWGWVKYNDFVHVLISDWPDDPWRIHPMVMQYKMCGHREIWDKKRFDLFDRAHMLLNEYATRIEKKIENETYIKTIL